MCDRPVNSNDTTIAELRLPGNRFFLLLFLFFSFFLFFISFEFYTSFQLLQLIYGSFRILLIKMFSDQSDVATAGLAPPPGIPRFKLSSAHPRAGFISR